MVRNVCNIRGIWVLIHANWVADLLLPPTLPPHVWLAGSLYKHTHPHLPPHVWLAGSLYKHTHPKSHHMYDWLAVYTTHPPYLPPHVWLAGSLYKHTENNIVLLSLISKSFHSNSSHSQSSHSWHLQYHIHHSFNFTFTIFKFLVPAQECHARVSSHPFASEAHHLRLRRVWGMRMWSSPRNENVMNVMNLGALLCCI